VLFSEIGEFNELRPTALLWILEIGLGQLDWRVDH
jgi:hypothetical protein